MSNTMQKRELQNHPEPTQDQDFITIIAPTMAEVMESFRAQGLAAQHYTIVHRAGRHSFTMTREGRDDIALFDGLPMVAATFARCA